MEKMNRRFTELVTDFLSKGMFFAQSMAGCSGEEMRVDVSDGTDTYRVVMTRGFDFEAMTDIIIIEVRKFEDTVYFERTTLWDKNGEVVLHEEYSL